MNKVKLTYLLTMTELGFNDMSTLVGHFILSPRERKKRDSRGDEREGQGRKKKKMNKSEETEEIKTFPSYPYQLQRQQALPNCKPISAGQRGDVRYMTPLPHPTTPTCLLTLLYLPCVLGHLNFILLILVYHLLMCLKYCRMSGKECSP